MLACPQHRAVRTIIPAAAAAAAAENGPYNLEHNMTLSDNPWGWDVAANMIFVDQPINTGFSWSDVSSNRSNSHRSRMVICAKRQHCAAALPCSTQATHMLLPKHSKQQQ